MAVMFAVPSFKPGVYLLTSAKCESVLDLSGGDNKTVIGFPLHGLRNQQWKFEPLGAGFSIESVSSGLYMTTQFDIHPDGGKGWQIVVGTYPVAWQVEVVSEGTIRISWPNTRYAFTLAREGDSTPGTKLELCLLVPDSQQTPSHQLWISERISNSKSERKLTPASSDGVNSSESNPKVQLSSPDSESEEVERSVTSSTTTSTLPHVSGKGKRAETTITTVITTTMVTRVLPTVVSL